MGWRRGSAVSRSSTVDPPYYDNVMYAECSNFFYIWMKRTLGEQFPDLFCYRTHERRRRSRDECGPLQGDGKEGKGTSYRRLREQDVRLLQGDEPGLAPRWRTDRDVHPQAGPSLGYTWLLADAGRIPHRRLMAGSHRERGTASTKPRRTPPPARSSSSAGRGKLRANPPGGTTSRAR